MTNPNPDNHTNDTTNPDPLQSMIGQEVVLDTATPIAYIGKLIEITDYAFVLQNADLHDCRDGHANKEMYLLGVCEAGLAVNRRKVVVLRTVVISVSLLSDVVNDITEEIS